MYARIPDLEQEFASEIQPFAFGTAERLLGIRNGVLLFGQGHGSQSDLTSSIQEMTAIGQEARQSGRSDIAELAEKCKGSIIEVCTRNDSAPNVLPTLDLIAVIEEKLLALNLGEDEFLPDVSGFVDASFESFEADGRSDELVEDLEFEVDEETLEIFRSEASDLLANISESLSNLAASPENQEFLWAIRRSVHTLKGAAGIVGLKTAADLSHHLEDILDALSNEDRSSDNLINRLIERVVRYLEFICLDAFPADELESIELLYSDIEKVRSILSPSPGTKRKDAAATTPQAEKTDASAKDESKHNKTPIVRISLERLDELIGLSSKLSIAKDGLLKQIEGSVGVDANPQLMDLILKISPFLEIEQTLTAQIADSLTRIRMVRFGTLETRLGRAVHVTCQEENKKARLVLENPDCEIDTQVIDALIEPLLHLLKNAVVHGIEPVETRRLIGKAEVGSIKASISKDDRSIILTIEDDGRGISAAGLIAKAVNSGSITPERAMSMTDDDACELIFCQGLTTAEKLDLNAGRGLGMNIVRESVENCGGSIAVDSAQNIGTCFRIRMPLTIGQPRPEPSGRSTEIPVSSLSKGTLSVLVVDDSPSVRRHNCKLVEKLGHRVIIAENGLEALKLLQSQGTLPDLILSDVEMPTMDGLAFLNCVRSDPRVADVPVIMVTSFTSEEARSFAIDAGAADYLPKPLTTEKLLTGIAQVSAVSKGHLTGG